MEALREEGVPVTVVPEPDPALAIGAALAGVFWGAYGALDGVDNDTNRVGLALRLVEMAAAGPLSARLGERGE